MEIVIYSDDDIIKPLNTTNIRDTESIKYWRFLLVSLESLDGICTVLYLCLSLCRCDPCVCVIASSDSCGQVTRSPGPISIVPISDQLQSWPGSPSFKDGNSGQRGLWCLTRICVWCSLSVSRLSCVKWSLFTLWPTDLSQHSSKGPLIAHVYVTECLTVALSHVSTWTGDPGLVSSCYTAAKLVSWAQHYHVCDNLTICLRARHNKHHCVESHVSISCALCHCVRVNTGLTLHQRRSSLRQQLISRDERHVSGYMRDTRWCFRV